MIKILLLMLFFLIGSHPLRAEENLGNDQDFMQQLDNVKNPFEDGYPKPVPLPTPVLVYHPPEPKPVLPIEQPKPRPVPVPVKLPAFAVQGVIVGEDINEAIINDKVVPLHGVIKGAQVVSVTKKGVGFLYKGKKFFLKVD